MTATLPSQARPSQRKRLFAAVKSAVVKSSVFRTMRAGGVAVVLGTTALSGAVSTAQAQDIAATFDKYGDATVDHSAWTELLRAYVTPGASGLNSVDYAAFKADGHTALKDYLAQITAVDPTTLTKNAQFAYWANLYNAKTIDIVLEHYPVATIRDIDISGFFSNGPWDKKVTKVNGLELSLNDIEHVIMRGTFKDPRVHYAVNCASIGCPNLQRKAFVGPTLEAQLDAAARDYVNSPRGFTVANGRVRASKIYSWFQEDFGDSEAGVIAHAVKYAEPELKGTLTAAGDISGYDYDWSLNDTKK
ncbi:MAG: DUF547 domain-containing protein [Pseudomonadota bacterium]